MPRLLVVQHVPHERLGTFEPVFEAAGCSLRTLHAADPKAPWPKTLDGIDGIVSMGGPQSVYEQAQHPYFAREIALMQAAVKAGKPLLGVCLGAQLLAAALGAKVMKNPAGNEIGWYPLMQEPARPSDRHRRAGGADGDPLCEAFGQTETVFQWHGDTFVLPTGAVRLFSSPLCQEQAFRYRDNVYGLQFHVEVTEAMIRAWLSNAGNKKELTALKGRIDPAAIRAQTPQHMERLQALSRHVASAWCSLINPSPQHSRSLSHARR